MLTAVAVDALSATVVTLVPSAKAAVSAAMVVVVVAAIGPPNRCWVPSSTLQSQFSWWQPHCTLQASKARRVRPICISDAISRLVAKCLFACYKTSFTNVFKKAHPRALQFGANLKNCAMHMFHLISGVIHSSTVANEDDPVALASLNIKNAFNTLSHAP